MTTAQSCMGGWCTKRHHCAHYHAATPDQTPAERLCPPGQDGAGLMTIYPEPVDMPRENYLSLDSRLSQVAALLKPSGVTRTVIAKAIGIRAKSAMNRIMAAAEERGIVFQTFARVSETMKTPEMVCFPNPEDRDAFRASYESEKIEQRRELQRIKSRENYVRNRDRYSAERIAQRAAARVEREAKDKAKDPQHLALRAAEKEIAAQRKRQYREAKAAEKQREKAEAKKLKTRLKAETKAAGRLVFKGGTDSPKPKKPAFADLPVVNPNGVKPQVIPCKLRDRFAADDAPSVISSRECRPWAEVAAA